MSNGSKAYQIAETGQRPWGGWTVVDAGARFVVKRLVVRPGARLSLQRHRWRDEHWVVVGGRAEVALDGVNAVVEENGSVFIPAGQTHRLANPGPGDLVVVEVQYGQRLEEGDIERLEDSYGRS